MKSKTLTWFIAMTLFASLSVPVRLAAQGQNQQPPRYTVKDLGTLGGTFFSRASGITTKARWLASRSWRVTQTHIKWTHSCGERG